jgi:SAM-dependent methyltransferase
VSAKTNMYAKHAQLLDEQVDEYFDTPAKEVLAIVPGDVRRALEVGCGAGATLAALKERQPCEVVGVEIETAAAQRARIVLDAVYEFDAEEEKLPRDELFDLLILNHVIEHFINPWEALRRWVAYVRPGGYVIVGVPNIAHYKILGRLIFRDEFQHEPRGILDWTHLRYFTAVSIERLMGEAGLTILQRERLMLVAGGWKGRVFFGVLPFLRRFFSFATLVLARKESDPTANYVPFGDTYTV